MAGSDLCDWTVVGPHYFSNPLEYTQELGRRVGCDPDYGVPMEILMECLRSKHFDEIVNASASVWRKVRAAVGGGWGGVGVGVGVGGVVSGFVQLCGDDVLKQFFMCL